MRIFITAEGKCVASDSEVLVMFVTLFGKAATRNISE
jgi:hypothetical protein